MLAATLQGEDCAE